jgi:hypothetical protein
MKDTTSPSSEGNTHPASTTNPLDRVYQRVANEAEKILIERWTSLARSSIDTDPGVRQSILQLLEEETASLTAILKREWDTRVKEFLVTQERLANQERQFIRSQAEARTAERRSLLKQRLTNTLRVLVFAVPCLVAAGFLALLVPDAVRRIWEPPYLTTLETQNQQLWSQVTLLRRQPVLKDRIMLYPGPQGIWAEVEPGAKPVLTDMFSQNPADTHQAWLIPLRQQKP